MTKINKKTEETNKTLALILAKLINPNAVHPHGFTTPFSTPFVTAQFSQFASTSSPIVTTQSTSIVQFASISSPIVTTQSTSIGQFASISSPIVTTQSTSIESTSIVQFASIQSPIVTTQSTSIMQYSVSANMELSPQPTPICAHFETVSLSVLLQSSIPISQSSSGILDAEKIKAVCQISS